MINIQKIKAVVFDFDDTLCIHTKHEEMDELEYYYGIVNNSNFLVERNCQWNSQMYEFIKYCKSKDIRMAICSATGFYPVMEAKQESIENAYGIKLDNLCIGGASNKNLPLQYYAKLLGLENDEILLVDDLYSNVEAATKEGFQACSPMEVVNFVNYKVRAGIIQSGGM